MYKLRADTPDAWAQCVVDNFDEFLLEHAAAERKAGAAAKHFAVRYRDKPELIDVMLEIAIEELEHFRQVFHLLRDRGQTLGEDAKNPYMNRLLGHARSSGLERMLDRLLIGSITEYRGCERFAILSRKLEGDNADEELVVFYRDLAADDSRHRAAYYEMACRYVDDDRVDARLDAFLDREAEIVEDLGVRPALH
ncbi:MAG: tRNA isopentenyl-2-thiomethyl-A-37 hydroxylase MiaE [Bradymonadaceae bacterium]